MPAFQIFDGYARNVEMEMSQSSDQNLRAPQTLPVCSSENELSATHCSVCDEEFPIGHAR